MLSMHISCIRPENKTLSQPFYSHIHQCVSPNLIMYGGQFNQVPRNPEILKDPHKGHNTYPVPASALQPLSGILQQLPYLSLFPLPAGKVFPGSSTIDIPWYRIARKRYRNGL